MKTNLVSVLTAVGALFVITGCTTVHEAPAPVRSTTTTTEQTTLTRPLVPATVETQTIRTY